MECKLLRTVDFKLDMEAHIPSFSYTRIFSYCLYEKSGGHSATQ